MTTIREGVTLSATGSLDLYNLTTIPESVTLSSGGHLKTNQINQKWRGKRLRSVDCFLMEVLSSVEFDGTTLHNCRYFGETVACRVAEMSGVFAHGKTAKEAVSDVKFKLAQRDIPTVVEEIKRTEKVTPFQYRIITGACSEGTRQFCELYNFEYTEEIPLADFMKLIPGYYGFEAFQIAVN